MRAMIRCSLPLIVVGALIGCEADAPQNTQLGKVAAEGTSPAEIPDDPIVLLGDNSPLLPNIFVLLRGSDLIVVGDLGKVYPLDDLVLQLGDGYGVWDQHAAPFAVEKVLYASPDVDPSSVTVLTQHATTCAKIVFINGEFRKNVPETGCLPLTKSSRIDNPGKAVFFLYQEEGGVWWAAWRAAIGDDGMVDFTELGMKPQDWPPKVSFTELADQAKSQKELLASQAPKKNPPPPDSSPTP